MFQLKIGDSKYDKGYIICINGNTKGISVVGFCISRLWDWSFAKNLNFEEK